MQVNITPTILAGKPHIPADKSWIIRYMIVSRIRGCDLVIRNINLCDDVLACMDCLDNLGGEMNVGESATVLRLLLPWVVKTFGKADFILEGSLAKRPMGPYREIFPVFDLNGCHLHVEGPVSPREMDRTVSSQFFSGMLLAGYDMGECVSGRYLDMTRKVLEMSGPFDVTVPEDITLKAFFGSYEEIDTADEPDLVVPKAYLAAVSGKECRFAFPERIRYKESDRLVSVLDVLSSVGISAGYEGNEMIIRPGTLRGGKVDSHGDHRIAIMAAMLAQHCEEEVIIENAECVSKSWPGFFEEYERLGGIISVV